MIELTNDMELLMVGDSNWDYYYDKKYSGVYAIAKKYSGASNSTFGNASYFYLFVKRYNHYDKLTSFGKQIYNNYKDYTPKNYIQYA